MNREAFLKAYIEAALWSEVDDKGIAFDESYDEDDIDKDSLVRMTEDCTCFCNDNEWLIEQAKAVLHLYTDEWAGHDFWLTRNGHGAGFWDRGLEKVGEKLTEAAKAWGSCSLYVTDDGHVGYME